MHFRTIVQPIEEPMATIKANGGAASVWECTGHHSDSTPYTFRVVLCRNGKVLTGSERAPITTRKAEARKLAALVGQRKSRFALSVMPARQAT
jgi:hypothetical protein